MSLFPAFFFVISFKKSTLRYIIILSYQFIASKFHFMPFECYFLIYFSLFLLYYNTTVYNHNITIMTTDSDKNEGYLKTNITHQYTKADVNRKKEENALKIVTHC